MKKILILAFLFPCLVALSDEKPTLDVTNLVKQFEAKLHYQKGEVSLKSGLAKLNLPDSFRYLPPADADAVLVKLWGNPAGQHTLGMIVPANLSLASHGAWAVVIQYEENGYVKDSDADTIDYTKMLKDMQTSVHDENEQRKKEGYPTVELVGWAAPPRYDKEAHKLFWAKEIRFNDSPENTLNYNIRVLGRRGVLILNAVASMRDFAAIEKQTPEIVKMAEFKEGNRYADFDSKSGDKTAAYGLAALVAGGIAAKAGFFKLLWVGLIAAKKFIIIGVIALVAFIKKMFAGKDSTPPSAGS